ncbi:hypothetical protein GCM10022295_82080 [Streptomyces osmaniensis]|uniref:Uncharacterized protein n=1 Tax=Streptomyces osmaniensis TaxID=593134 RepID=A0ABP6YQG3_9ACTN
MRQAQRRPADSDDLGDIGGLQTLLEEAVADKAASAEDHYLHAVMLLSCRWYWKVPNLPVVWGGASAISATMSALCRALRRRG